MPLLMFLTFLAVGNTYCTYTYLVLHLVICIENYEMPKEAAQSCVAGKLLFWRPRESIFGWLLCLRPFMFSKYEWCRSCIYI